MILTWFWFGKAQPAHLLMRIICSSCYQTRTSTHLLTSAEMMSSPSARYCPTCKNDTSEVVKAGEKLKASKKKAKMPSATTESQRDWGKVRPKGTQRYTQTRWTTCCSVRLKVRYNCKADGEVVVHGGSKDFVMNKGVYGSSGFKVK